MPNGTHPNTTNGTAKTETTNATEGIAENIEKALN
jgi:hypothetical protein